MRPPARHSAPQSTAAHIDNALASLNNCPLFSGLGEPVLRELAQASAHVQLHKDQSLWRPGDIATKCYIVTSGLLKRTALSYAGSERVLDLLMPDDCLGASELLAGQPYGTLAVAVRPSSLLAINGEIFHSILAKTPAVGERLGKWLAKLQLHWEEETAAQHSRPSSERVLNFLLQRVQGALPTTGETTLRLPASKQLLAARIGITPETFSRSLRELGDAGLAIAHGNVVHLQNGPLNLRQRALAPMPTAPMSTASASIPLYSVINMAGRQRMLSQRMAKFWLMAGCGLAPARARRNLTLSIELFENQRRQLEEFTTDSEIDTLRLHLGKLWSHYRQLLESTPTPTQAATLFSLNEEVLHATEAQTCAYATLGRTDAGKLVNIAGRQRMLAQRIAKFRLFQHYGTQVKASRQGMANACEEFGISLDQLKANAPTADIASSLNNLHPLWQSLQYSIAHDAAEPLEVKRQATAVSDLSEKLVRQLDGAVYHYQRYAERVPCHNH